MTHRAWVTPEEQQEIAGGPLEKGDVIYTDRELAPADPGPLPRIVGRRRWTCIGVLSDGYALVRTRLGATS